MRVASVAFCARYLLLCDPSCSAGAGTRPDARRLRERVHEHVLARQLEASSPLAELWARREEGPGDEGEVGGLVLVAGPSPT